MLALLLALACAHSPRDVSALLPGDVTPIGHRGAAGLAVENSMPAFEEALRLGVAFELDVHLTSDGVPVVFHDDELARLTGVEGSLAEHTLAELRAMPLSDGSTIPTLAEVFALVDGQVIIDVEVKSVPGTDNATLAAAVAEVIATYPHQDRIYVTSFSPFLLKAMAEVAPDLPRGQLIATFEDSELKGYEKALLKSMAFNRGADVDFVAVEHDMVDEAYLRKQHRRGYPVLVWTVNDPERIEALIAMGVDGVISDRPDLVLEALGSEAP